MPKYEVLARSYIGGRVVEPGDVVDYEGVPGSALREVEPPTPKKDEPKKPAEPPLQPAPPTPKKDDGKH